ncbi:hypothetical protein [Cecembia lonarensis]|uniref:PIN domain-containing protein n=1 Tax=Cecembia lonarensis (strain CCUG 58316 / KCTC 22772 / LW9) TaxID=1225176 RepID=K1LDF4_CECL9|nr:hypothetical protein [Cecembia lonarensis]EKB50177.1 hypothetical protein B879_01182 [Cecembia lonarensis LW9]
MKTTFFLDTNVVLDLLGERIPFYDPIARIASLADRNEIQFISTLSQYPPITFLFISNPISNQYQKISININLYISTLFPLKPTFAP